MTIKQILDDDRKSAEQIPQIPTFVLQCCCCCHTKTKIMDSMQKKVLVWAAIGFVIAVFYIALSLVTWKVLGLIGP